MKIRAAMALSICAFSCLPGALWAEGGSGESRNTLSNVVYVNSNNPTTGRNAVLGYRRNPATGDLTELAGSPFLTGGTGYYNSDERLGPDDSDQELAVTADRRFLYAVNQGSGTVAGFRVHNDGSLSAVPGSPFPSGGMQPASIGIDGFGLFVVNRGDQNPGGTGGSAVPNYSGFLILPNGALVPIPWSKLSLAPGISPTQALISPNGKLMFDAHLFETPFNNAGFPPFVPPYSSELHSYRISPLGQITPAAQIAPPAPIPPFVLGLQAHPHRKILYVGYVLANLLATYTYDDNGDLTLVGTTPNGGVGICWITLSPDAKIAYTAESVTDQLGVYSLADPLHPALLQTVSLKGPKALSDPSVASVYTTTPFQLHTSPDGEFLYVVNHEVTVANTFPDGNAIHILKIGADGTLTETASSPMIFPQGEVPANGHALGILVF